MFFNTYCVSCTLLGSRDTEVGESMEKYLSSHGTLIPTGAKRHDFKWIVKYIVLQNEMKWGEDSIELGVGQNYKVGYIKGGLSEMVVLTKTWMRQEERKKPSDAHIFLVIYNNSSQHQKFQICQIIRLSFVLFEYWLTRKGLFWKSKHKTWNEN